MLEDKFKFTRANIILIVVNVVLVLFVIFASVQLIISLKDSSGEIPELKTTAGKSSTKEADATSTTVTETTTTTTKKQGNATSPYYNADIYSILDKELVQKDTLSKEERITLGKQYFKVLEGLLEGSDDDLINVTHLLKTAKDGEKDKVTINGNNYGIIYGGKDFLQTFLYNDVINKLVRMTKNDINVIYKDSSTREYYKLGSTTGQKEYEVIEFTYSYVSESEYKMTVVYKNKSDGAKSTNFKSSDFNIKYMPTEKMWKIYRLSFPNLED